MQIQSSKRLQFVRERDAARQIDIKRKRMKINHYRDVVTTTAAVADAPSLNAIIT